MTPRLTMSATTAAAALALLVLLICDVTRPVAGDVNFTCPTSVCACRAELVGGRTRRVIDCASRALDAVPDLMAFTGLNFDEVRVNDNLIQSVARGAFRGADVTKIDLSDNPRLEGFSNFAFKYLPKLEELVIERSKMSSVPVALKDLPALTHLRLAHNTVRRLPATAFSSMVGLKYLDLAHNQAEFPTSFSAFAPLSQLEHLNLENNGLYNVPIEGIRGKVHLHTLILSHNHIHSISLEVLQGLKSLRRLELVGNPLRFTDPSSGFLRGLNLEVLSLGNTDLGRTLTPQMLLPFPRLTSLTLRGCHIHAIPKGTFSVLKHLRALDVSLNPFRVSAAVFHGIENRLDSLGLSGVNLTKYPTYLLSRFPRLKDIDLSQNKIRAIPSGIFRKLPYQDARIDLSDNQIKTISEHIMDGVRRPATLLLARNQIRELTWVSRNPCRFDDVFLDLTGNPVHCDCHTHALIQRKVFELIGTCHTPPHHKNLKLMYWPDTELNRRVHPASTQQQQIEIEWQEGLSHFEQAVNVTEDCGREHRLAQRFECTCGTWQDIYSPTVCAVVGASPKISPSSIVLLLIFITSFC